jgi:SynChlorMet cassette radical SAM/SPASM protein ScmF
VKACDKREKDIFMDGVMLKSLYINPTRYCNLSCRHCWIAPPVKDELGADEGEMSMKEIIAVIAEARKIGTDSIKLTGGEPLLRKDIGEVLEYCFAHDIRVDIETNGTLVTPDVARLFRFMKVNHVAVSIDSPYEEAHDGSRGKRGAFKETLEGVRNLTGEGIYPQVIITLYRENMEVFGDFLDLMKSLCVDNVKVNIISPVGKGSKLVDSGIAPDVEEILGFSDKLESLRKDFQGTIYLDKPMAFRSLEELKHGGSSVCAIKRILGILSDGSVSICGIGYVDEDLVFGNVREDPSMIKEIWEKNHILRQIREDLAERLEGVCGMCVFKKLCLGCCRAAEYSNTGNLFKSCWFCQEAYEKGLFPSTRLIPREMLAK